MSRPLTTVYRVATADSRRCVLEIHGAAARPKTDPEAYRLAVNSGRRVEVLEARTDGPVSLIWPHRDGLIWPHLRHAGDLS